MEFIKHFSEIDDADLPRVGGKGLNLGKLTRAGFRVPNGFCVTTDAYRLSVQGLSEQNERSIKNIGLSPELVAEIHTAPGKIADTYVCCALQCHSGGSGGSEFCRTTGYVFKCNTG